MAFDYTSVSPADLELIREPRKSKFTIKHVPTGQTATDPVTPETHQPARFRRPNVLPKENRVKDMVGYIEGDSDSPKLWLLVAGDTPKNEYLDALCADPEALRISFEGAPATATEPPPVAEEQPAVGADPALEVGGTTPRPEAPAAPPSEPVDTAPAAEESTTPPEPPAETAETAVDAGEMAELDELLSGLSN